MTANLSLSAHCLSFHPPGCVTLLSPSRLQPTMHSFHFLFSIHLYHSFPFLHSSHFPISPPSSPDPFLHRFPSRKSLQGICTKHALTKVDKTGRKPPFRGWVRQPSRGKRVSRVEERVRDTLPTTVRNPTKTSS